MTFWIGFFFFHQPSYLENHSSCFVIQQLSLCVASHGSEGPHLSNHAGRSRLGLSQIELL